MNVIFSYDPARELLPLRKGRASAFNASVPAFTQGALDKGIDLDSDEASLAYIEAHLESSGTDVEKKIIAARARWDPISEEVELRFRAMFPTDVDLGEITAYLTQSTRCPYSLSEKLFYISMSEEAQIQTMLHELQHFYVHTLYEERFRQAGRSDFEAVKEALTVVLNHTCLDLMERPDRGYSAHAELRIQISDLWQQHRSIEKIIDTLLS